MADEPENLTLRLLQETRLELHDLRTGMRDRFTTLDKKLKKVNQRVTGLTVMVGAVMGTSQDHEERIEELESR